MSAYKSYYFLAGNSKSMNFKFIQLQTFLQSSFLPRCPWELLP